MVAMGRPTFEESINSVKDADEQIIMNDDFAHRKEQVALMNEAAAKSTGEYIVFMGERQVLVPDWKERTLKALEKLRWSGLVSYREYIATAGCLSRDFYLNELGGNFWSPDYVHYCPDIEIADVARKYAKYTEALDVLFKQYEKTDNPHSTEACAQFDRTTYNKRAREGWPNRRLRTDEERSQFL